MSDNFKRQIDNLFKQEKRLIYDSALLETLDEAKRGNPVAWLDISEAFLWENIGNQTLPIKKFRAIRNLNIARFFNSLVISYLRWNLGLAKRQLFTAWTQNKVTYMDLVREIRDAAVIEDIAQNYPDAKKHYLEAIDLMIGNVDPAEWDFEIFGLFKCLLHSSYTK